MFKGVIAITKAANAPPLTAALVEATFWQLILSTNIDSRVCAGIGALSGLTAAKGSF